MGEQDHSKHLDIHIGNLIKEELERQERSVSWFARKLCCDRSNIYKIFKRATIDTELLLRISLVLNHDFFVVYTAQFGQITSAMLGVAEPQSGYISNISVD